MAALGRTAVIDPLNPTNENPFAGQKYYSKHVAELMYAVNELEADHHLHLKRTLTVGPGGNAELIGVCEHHSGSLLFYFCDPSLKRVYVCNPDQSEPVYQWPVSVTMTFPGYTLTGSSLLFDDPNGTLALAPSPYWRRSICVDEDGYVYVAIFAQYRQTPAISSNYMKYVWYIARYNSMGQNIQSFVMEERNCAGWWLLGHAPSGIEIWERDWYSPTGSVAVYGDKLVYTFDRACLSLKQWPDPDRERVPIPSRMEVRNKVNGGVISRWVSPSYAWDSSPEDMYNGILVKATAKGVHYVAVTRKEAADELGRPVVCWAYAHVAREWDGKEMCAKKDSKLVYEGPWLPSVPRLVLFPYDTYRSPYVASKRGFLATDDYLVLPLAAVTRRVVTKPGTNPQFIYDAHWYRVQYTVAHEELTEDEAKEGKRPEVEVEPKAEPPMPATLGVEFGGRMYVRSGATVLEYGLFDELTEWYGYQHDPYVRTAIGTYPEPNALAEVQAETVGEHLYDLRDALGKLLALEDFFRPMGITYYNDRRVWHVEILEPDENLISEALSLTENTYGLKGLWNRWRHMGVDNAYMYDVDIGEVHECVQALNGKMRCWAEGVEFPVSRFSLDMMAEAGNLP